MNRYYLLLLSIFLLSSTPSFAQTEAESISETLVFQKKEGNETLEIESGDRIVVFKEAKDKAGIAGSVISVSDTALLMKASGRRQIRVDLNKIAALRKGGAGSDTEGLGLIIGGAVLLAGFTLISMIGLILAYFLGPALLILGLLGLAGSILMIVFGAKKRKKLSERIILALWKWKMVLKKKVYVKVKKK